MPHISPERAKAYHLKYYKQNRERCIARVKECRDRVRTLIRERYGSECLQCGYSTDTRALHIDHVVGGGEQERRVINGYPFWLKVSEAVTTGLYQVLCANCNAIKKQEAV